MSTEAVADGGGPTLYVIRDTALSFFADDGYDNTSMRKIASAVGIRVASLYSHFPSKESILWMICEEAMGQLLSQANSEAVVDGAIPKRFEAFVESHFRYHIENRSRCVVVNDRLRSLSPEHFQHAGELRDMYEHRLREIIEAGVREGCFSTADARLASYSILATGMHIAKWYRADGELTQRQVIDGNLQIARRIVGDHTRP